MGKQSIGKLFTPPITCYNLSTCIYLPLPAFYLLPINDLVYVPGIGNAEFPRAGKRGNSFFHSQT